MFYPNFFPEIISARGGDTVKESNLANSTQKVRTYIHHGTGVDIKCHIYYTRY